MSIDMQSTPPALAPSVAMVHRFSVEDYAALAEGGAFGEARVELLNGWICDMTPINPPHSFSVHYLQHTLEHSAEPSWQIYIQQVLQLPTSMPQPDVAVIRGTELDYARRHPTAADCVLVCEVADSSLATDRKVKSAVYAAAGVPEYWIVNLIDRCVERCTQPTVGADGVGRYAQIDVIRRGEPLPVGAFAQIDAIDTAKLLP